LLTYVTGPPKEILTVNLNGKILWHKVIGGDFMAQAVVFINTNTFNAAAE
jgi:hypothetical protein